MYGLILHFDKVIVLSMPKLKLRANRYQGYNIGIKRLTRYLNFHSQAVPADKRQKDPIIQVWHMLWIYV